MSRWIKLAVSLVITAVCLWWTFKDTTFRQFLEPLRAAAWGKTLALYLPVLTLIHLARTMRWGNLLSPLEKVPFKPLNEASAIGFMMLIILPFRLGEFARPFLIAQRSKITRSAAMSSVVLERIVDGLIIATLLFILMFFLPPDTRGLNVIRIGAASMFAVFGGGFVFLVIAAVAHGFVVKVLRATLGRLASGPTEKLIHVMDGFVKSFKQLPDAKNLTLFFVWTAVYWAANGFGTMLFANGFDCSGPHDATCMPLHLDLFQGYFLLCVMIVGLLIPAAPGSAGTVQAAVLIGLSAFFEDPLVKTTGLAFANALWLVQVLQQIVFGLIFMLTSHASFSDIAGKLSEQQKAQGEA